jgi:hypothetical protein
MRWRAADYPALALEKHKTNCRQDCAEIHVEGGRALQEERIANPKRAGSPILDWQGAVRSFNQKL